MVCKGLSEHVVASPEDVIWLMRWAQERRKVGETQMNKASSRSHCLFTVRVHTKRHPRVDFPSQTGQKAVLESSGKLHLVDLAGSECAKSSGGQEAGAA